MEPGRTRATAFWSATIDLVWRGSTKSDCGWTPWRSTVSGQSSASVSETCINKIWILAQDFTFTKQIKGRPIGLGEAGDCYSALQCVQGSFSINLEGTFLQIPLTQAWSWAGQDVSANFRREVRILWALWPLFRINPLLTTNSCLQKPQRISGKCGGYCGSCAPSTPGRLKLHVLPPWWRKWYQHKTMSPVRNVTLTPILPRRAWRGTRRPLAPSAVPWGFLDLLLLFAY